MKTIESEVRSLCLKRFGQEQIEEWIAEQRRSAQPDRTHWSWSQFMGAINEELSSNLPISEYLARYVTSLGSIEEAQRFGFPDDVRNLFSFLLSLKMPIYHGTAGFEYEKEALIVKGIGVRWTPKRSDSLYTKEQPHIQFVWSRENQEGRHIVVQQELDFPGSLLASLMFTEWVYQRPKMDLARSKLCDLALELVSRVREGVQNGIKTPVTA